MTYVPNTPALTETTLADSQPQFLINFQELFRIFAINHEPLNSAIAGDHSMVELVEQDHAIQTGTSEITIYSKDVPGQTDQVFIRYQGNGQEFQYTNYQIYAVTPQNGQVPYFTFLPGGLILYFGTFTTLPKDLLNLYPPVALNIITMDFCPTTTISNKPKVVIPAAQGRTYKSIIVTAANNINTTAPSCFYAVLANITDGTA